MATPLQRRGGSEPASAAGRSPVAFVLSGGCNLGAVQVGMLRALLEHEVQPDVILGCSVGALNGAGLAEDPSLAGVAGLERIWQGIDVREVMPRNRLPHALALARRGESIQPPAGLRQMLLRTFLARTFSQLRVPFECVATDVEDASEVWFGEGALVDAVMASAAMPALFPPVVIGGRRFVDGGVVNDVPLTRAVELGATRVYVLAVGSFSRPRAATRRPLDAVLQAYAMARQHRFAKDLAAVPDSVEVHVLPHGAGPGQAPPRFDDFSRTDELIETAYRASDAYLRGVVAPGTVRWADWVDV